jgi:hypothetical protein
LFRPLIFKVVLFSTVSVITLCKCILFKIFGGASNTSVLHRMNKL